MTGVQTLKAIVEIVLGGLTEIGTGLATGITGFIQGIVYSGSGESQTLGVVIILVAVFAGLSLGLNLFRKILNWITGFTKGNV